MRKWTVRELEDIEFDISCLTGELTDEDAQWLNERITTRELDNTFGPGQCDRCGITGEYLKIYIEDFSSAFDGPLPLSVLYLCTFCR